MACQLGHLPIVQYFYDNVLKQTLDQDDVFQAIRAGQYEVLKYLTNSVPEFKESIIYNAENVVTVAAAEDEIEALKILAQSKHYGGFFTGENSYFLSLGLKIAVPKKRTKIIDFLFEKVPDFKTSNLQDVIEKCTSVEQVKYLVENCQHIPRVGYLCRVSSVELARFFLDYFKNPPAFSNLIPREYAVTLNTYDYAISVRIPITSAALYYDLLKFYIKNGANTSAADYLNETPLMLAAKNNRGDCFSLLLKAGANPLYTYDKQTCLTCAVEANAVGIVAMLLKIDSVKQHLVNQLYISNDKNYLGSLGYISPLIAAAYHGYREIVELLVDAGANVEEATSKGETCMSITRSDSVRQYLMKIGAKMKISAETSQRVAREILAANDEEVFKYWLNYGVQVYPSKFVSNLTNKKMLSLLSELVKVELVTMNSNQTSTVRIIYVHSVENIKNVLESYKMLQSFSFYSLENNWPGIVQRKDKVVLYAHPMTYFYGGNDNKKAARFMERYHTDVKIIFNNQ